MQENIEQSTAGQTDRQCIMHYNAARGLNLNLSSHAVAVNIPAQVLESWLEHQ